MKEIRFLNIILIKSSKYDDDGFVVRYVKGVNPSNTLACMSSLTTKLMPKWEEEKNIRITVDIYDDIIDSIPYKKIAKENKGDTMVVAALVGVQSNQFPRASDIAQRLNALGVKTLIGGFHVCGVLALFDEPSSEIQELIDCGVTVVEGEAENCWERILSDIVEHREKLLYRKTGLPDISHEVVPQMDIKYLKKFAVPNFATIDCSRGCPFNCSFCTIVNVQGHTMRSRNAESVIKTIRNGYANGIVEYFFTDDNFSRNPAWEGIMDGLIHMREVEGLDMKFMMQVDMVCHKIPRFIEKAGKAGCTQVFIGMESLNEKNLKSVGKNQNKVDDYSSFIQKWHDVGVMTHVGYIIGFPYDTPESVRKDITRLINDIKVDQASFFILTPLPGSMDHFNMVKNGDAIDPDLDKYDSFHVVTEHPLMSSEELYGAYNEAWESFYTYENLKNILMRSGSKSYWSIFKNIMWYKNSLLEPRHPMVSGFIRKKDRKDIRSGFPEMGFWNYKAMRVRELLHGFNKRVTLFFELQELWLLTRKPDDPKFKVVADFSSVLVDAKYKLSSIELSDSCSKWVEELDCTLTALKSKIGNFYDTSELRGKSRKRFNMLIEDMNSYFDKVTISDNSSQGIASIMSYLSDNIRLAEEFTLKQVAKRRRITNFWAVTCDRIKKGNIIRFTLSTPRIIVSAIRDFRMSLSFAFHLKNKNF